MLSIRKIVDSYFSKRTFPHWCVLLLDSAILFLSGVFVYWCFNRGTALQLNFWPLTYLMLLCVGVHFIFFAIFRTYSGIIRYSSFNDLIRVALAMGCSALAVIAVHFFTNSCPSRVFAHVQVRHILIAEAIATGLMWLLRVSIKWVYDTYFRTEGAKNVFIYGIRAGGIGLAKAIRSEKPMHYCLRGFISHDPALGANGTRLMGEPVYEVDASLPDVIRRNGIAAVLVAPGRIDRFRNDTALQDYILQSGARIFSANNVVDTEHDAIKGAPTLKEVSIEDLLPRDEICVDLESVAESLRGKRILITGSAGSIGSEIVRQVASFAPSKMMLIDSAETPQHDIRRMMAHDFPSVPCATVVTSITKADRMENIFKTFLPEYVFHAAAYKHVPMMEDNPCESIQNNVLGTKILADLSVKYGVRRFVMVSTDKAVNPTNVMGCSKRICEVYVQSLNKAERDGVVKGQTQFITTRFGNVLGSNGSVIPIFERQIKAGGPVTVTDPNIIRYFMLIPEACELVLEAGTKGEGGEIFVFDMGKPVRIADLARRMIKLSGAKGVEIKYTGLRDGEKLYEEVLSESEATKPSFHEKIRIACVREYDWSDVSREIDALIAQSHTYDDMAVVASMKRIVPEYISNHSKYTVLDHKA
uniref:polysaccharide biosynthesis protein n=1 Tax=Candidatus Cryptobacteroides bacterium TaxID=3085639 RepID=UPI00402A1192